MYRRVLVKGVALVLGLFLLAAGISFMVQAKLGVSPWDVLHLGIANHIPLRFGQVMQLVGLVILLASLGLGIRPAFGTLANMGLVGFFFDLIIGHIPSPQTPIIAWGLLVAGVLVAGTGTGLYIGANLGAGPRDGLMLGIHKKTGWGVALVRTLIELTALTIGFLLGGPVGLGTLFISLSIGAVIARSLKFWVWVRREPTIRHLLLGEALPVKTAKTGNV